MNALILIKPDAFERKLVNQILQLISVYEIEHIRDLIMTEELCDRHYEEHIGKSFYPALKEAMVGKKVIAIFVLYHATLEVRSLCDSFRATYVDTAYIGPRNLIHCSDSHASAKREKRIWFPKKEEELIHKASKVLDTELFVNRCKETVAGDSMELFGDFEDDLRDCKFDLENIYSSKEDGSIYEDLLGLQTIGDLTFFGVAAGGDWEFPVYFILYLDTKNNPRAYIPKRGNVWNQKSKHAFGNCEEKDAEYLNKVLELVGSKDEFVEADAEDGEVLFNFQQIVDEITSKIVVA